MFLNSWPVSGTQCDWGAFPCAVMKGSHDGVTSGPSWPGMSVERHNSSGSSLIKFHIVHLDYNPGACGQVGGEAGILYLYIFYCLRQFIKGPVKEAVERAQQLRGLADLA